MSDVSTFRLYLMRATYLFILVGLGFTIWPGVIKNAMADVPSARVLPSLLTAVSLLATLGIRYPLQMLPLLLFELVWKSIWLISAAYPLWLSGQQIDATTMVDIKACLMGIVIFPIVIPWSYVFANYLKKRGDRWDR